MFDLPIIISIIGVGIAFYTGIANILRNAKHDNKKDAGQIAMIMEKLANISLGIADLKTDLSVLTSEQNGLRERITRLETANEITERALKRIQDSLDEKKRTDSDADCF